MSEVTSATNDPAGEPEFVLPIAHHFKSMPQQLAAAELGMWLFLATEILLFGGLFCAYAVFRFNHPALFAWGGQLLDVKLGATNTVVLIVSSMTMAGAVTLVQLGRRWPAAIALAATFLCGVIFMAIKSVEYEHKFHENVVWGVGFYETPEHVQTGETIEGEDVTAVAGDMARGLEFWSATCRSCHGVAGEGVAGQGKDIRASAFIHDRDDAALLAFIKVGRMPFDPINTTGIQMPPRGGNPLLRDGDLIDIIAYLRSFMLPVGQGDSEGGAGATPAGDATIAAEPGVEEFWIPRSSIPLAPRGPRGLNPLAMVAAPAPAPEHEETAVHEAHLHHTLDPDRPANAHLFFGIYFIMTGLHGVHVLAGMVVIGWLLFRNIRGDFAPGYFTPVHLGGLYWHIVDIIWIFLFPLLYLIPT